MHQQAHGKRYAALLRGVNQSGKNKMPMSDLRQVFCELGFTDVETILNSGNELVQYLMEDIRPGFYREIGPSGIIVAGKNFGCGSAMEVAAQVVYSAGIRIVLAKSFDKSRYHNLIFILTEESPQNICGLIGEPSEGMEQTEIYEDVIFWSYDLSCYQKCNWWKKTESKGIAEKLTIRTGNTIRKICRQGGSL